MTWLGIAAVGAVAATVLAELAGRYAGFHRPLLYERTDFGYRILPEQNLRFLGRRVRYNAFGLRSEHADPLPRPGVVRVLCLGDSITNGGTGTDQADTYPYLLAERLRASGVEAEVLNASAGGWALENEAGWLAANGTFGSRFVVLEVATHDLFQRMAGSHIVDLNPRFPSRPPPAALVGFWRRIVLPRLGLAPDTRDPNYEPGVYTLDDVRRGLAQIERMRGIVHAAGGTLVIVPVEQPVGLEPTDEQTLAAKRMLADYARASGAPLIPTAERMHAAGGAALFADGLHPNPAGNRALADIVADGLLPLLRPGASGGGAR